MTGSGAAARRRRTRALLLRVALLSALGGGVYGGLVSGGPGDPVAGGVLLGLVAGLVIGFLCTAGELLLRSLGALRALPFAALLLLRALVFAAGIVTGLAAADGIGGLGPGGLRPGPWLGRGDFWLSLAAAFAVAILLELSRLLGPQVLLSLVTGRYHRPREEERVFLFADVEGSTALAERIGHVAFHRFLGALFADLGDPILATGGEIYRYVGDEVIVTWRIEEGVRDGACLACALAIGDRLAEIGPAYAARFGAAPAMRCALHAGPVVAGEMGDIRKEIAFLGDTVNTTARLEKAARDLGVRVLVSAELARRLPPDPAVALDPMGPVRIAGRSAPVEVLAARRLSAGPSAG